MAQFTAADAAQLANEAVSLDGPYGRKETDSMLERIRGCARKGQRNTSLCGVPAQFRDIVKCRLEAVGFKVKEHQGRESDENYVDISW
jgi:hypothetical protein